MKLTITSCTNTGKVSKQGSAIFNVTASEGDKEYVGSTFDDLTGKIAETIEIEMKPSNIYNGVQQYYFSLPKVQQAGGNKFPAKDWAYQKKKDALSLAVESAKCAGKPVSSEEIKVVANSYLTWLKAE